MLGEENNEINEPSPSYADKRITFFSSFEEMENHQLAFYASQSSEELLKNHKVLSMAAYGLTDESEAGGMERKIKFNKDA